MKKTEKKTNKKKFNWKRFWLIVMIVCFVASAVLFIAGVSVAAVANQPPVTENPGDTEQPGTTEPPVTENPGDTEQPGTTEPPVTENPDDTTEPPVTENPDDTTEPPVTENPGDSTEQPGDNTENPGSTENPGTIPDGSKVIVDIARFDSGKYLLVLAEGYEPPREDIPEEWKSTDFTQNVIVVAADGTYEIVPRG